MESRLSDIPNVEGGTAAGGGGVESSGCARGRGGSKVVMRPDGSFYFEVDSTPGDTTVVSWKKLLRVHAAEIAAGASSALRPNAGGQFPDLNALPVSSALPPNPSLDTRIAPAPSNHLNAVIEKIDRLYGIASSDEEDLNDVVPDDEYDTDDSFIDDSELKEYFLADNSAKKYDGYFVHRGKLERVEPSMPSEQLKKRERKDLAKGSVGHDNDKHGKPGKKPRKPAPLAENTTPGASVVLALPARANYKESHISKKKAIKNLEKLVEESSALSVKIQDYLNQSEGDCLRKSSKS